MTDLLEQPAAPTEAAPETPTEKNQALREIADLTAIAEARDAELETTREKRREIDTAINDIQDRKRELLTDLKGDPIKLGKQIAELDHAVSVLEFRRGPADAVTAEAKAAADAAWEAVSRCRGAAVGAKLHKVYTERTERVRDLMSDFGLPWKSAADYIRAPYVQAIDHFVYVSRLGRLGPLGVLWQGKASLGQHGAMEFLDDDFDTTGETPE